MSKYYLQCLEAIPVIIFHHGLVSHVGNETNKVFRIPNVNIFRVIQFLSQNMEYRFIRKNQMIYIEKINFVCVELVSDEYYF